jgi:hypothetical protein
VAGKGGLEGEGERQAASCWSTALSHTRTHMPALHTHTTLTYPAGTAHCTAGVALRRPLQRQGLRAAGQRRRQRQQRRRPPPPGQAGAAGASASLTTPTRCVLLQGCPTLPLVLALTRHSHPRARLPRRRPRTRRRRSSPRQQRRAARPVLPLPRRQRPPLWTLQPPHAPPRRPGRRQGLALHPRQ